MNKIINRGSRYNIIPRKGNDDQIALSIADRLGIDFDTAYEIIINENAHQLSDTMAISDNGDVISARGEARLKKKIFKYIKEWGFQCIEFIFVKKQKAR